MKQIDLPLEKAFFWSCCGVDRDEVIMTSPQLIDDLLITLFCC